MPREQSPDKPTTRRYSEEEKASAVRMVRTLRAELGSEHGTMKRVAAQLINQSRNRRWRCDSRAPGENTCTLDVGRAPRR